jgi:hypothetical protein
VGKAEGKRLLDRPRRKRENNIEMNFGGIVWGGMDWCNLAQDGDQCQVLMNTL